MKIDNRIYNNEKRNKNRVKYVIKNWIELPLYNFPWKYYWWKYTVLITITQKWCCVQQPSNIWCGFDRASSLRCGNKMPIRWNRWFLLQILLLAQHVSGTIMSIIRSSRVLYKWLLPVVFGALVFKLSVPTTWKLSETCRVSWQNKFVKLVHLFGFITKKFVTMHGHMNVKQVTLLQYVRVWYFTSGCKNYLKSRIAISQWQE